MYGYELRVGISEVNAAGKLTLPSLIDYFQNCCSFQSEDLKVGIKYLEQLNYAWVLSGWQIQVERYPDFDEVIKVATIPYEIRGFLGMRNFCVLDMYDRPIVKANSMWTLLNVEQMKPARATQEMIDAYGKNEKLQMSYAPRKIDLPETLEKLDEILVRPYHLDTNRHMNNNQYIRIAQSYLPAEFETGELRVEYKHQAFLDEKLSLRYGTGEDGKVVFLMENEAGDHCAVMEFKNGCKEQMNFIY